MKAKMSNFFSGLLGVIIGAGLVLTTVVPQMNKVNITNTSNNDVNKTQVQETSKTTDITDHSSVYKNVVKSAMPSVVGITTVFLDDKSQDSYFDFFFGNSGTQVKQGLGTGVIVDSNGYILTNAHVVEDGKADKVNVLFNDGSTKEAEVKWYNESLDLAIIKVEGENYPVAKLGDSNKTEVGDIAIAIGNPLGLQFERTVTQGIISGLDRTVQLDVNTSMENLIQTDASINQGNSGGPLLNVKGEVIGINTIKATGGEGLGFSIPINTAKVFVDIIKQKGQIKEKPILGIKGISANQISKSEELKLTSKTGVYVYSVYDDSPAAKAKMKKGDIIIKINDDTISNMQDLQTALFKNGQNIEKPITVTVKRGEKEEVLKVQLVSEDELTNKQEKSTLKTIFGGNGRN